MEASSSEFGAHAHVFGGVQKSQHEGMVGKVVV